MLFIVIIKARITNNSDSGVNPEALLYMPNNGGDSQSLIDQFDWLPTFHKNVSSQSAKQLIKFSENVIKFENLKKKKKKMEKNEIVYLKILN